MRLVVFLAGICTLAVTTLATKYKIADKTFLKKQMDVFRLYKYVNQPSYYEDFVEISNAFKFEGQWDQWTKPQYAKEFYNYYQNDILKKGEVFSVLCPEHLKPAIALYRTFRYVKDYETFFKVAVWARQHVNEGMYVYALTLTLIHNERGEKMMPPPIYEVIPHFFFSEEVMNKAKQYKQNYDENYEEIKDKEYNGYTIQANYSDRYVHPEQSLSYFTDDIGVNVNYYYYHIFGPFWMTEEERGHGFPVWGQYFYWFHQQTLARYYMERLSNGLGKIPYLDYEHPVDTSYYPSLRHFNGQKFKARPKQAEFHYSHSHTSIADYERRLRDDLDVGYFYTSEGKQVRLYEKDGLEIFASLVENSDDSLNKQYHGDLVNFARRLLGYSYYPLDQDKVVPSAIEYFETSMRDPMFYQLFKRIMYFFDEYHKNVGPYKRKELYFDGVEIKDVKVERLITYFDYTYSDLSNGIIVNDEEFDGNTFEVRARQYRLNHKAFNYKIHVESDNATEALIKILIGPKYDEYGRVINIKQNRKNFFEIDRFQYNLQAGKNIIKRNSKESLYFGKDLPTYHDLYNQVLRALNGTEQYKVYEDMDYYGFPHRLILPRGDSNGKTFQFFVIVSPYHAPTKQDDVAKYLLDGTYSLGYPFDRPINSKEEFFVPNFYFKDVIIYHKNTEEDVNITNSKN